MYIYTFSVTALGVRWVKGHHHVYIYIYIYIYTFSVTALGVRWVNSQAKRVLDDFFARCANKL